MKNLYHINKVLIIINIALGLTIYLGLLFLIPLGIVQIIMSIIIAYNEKKLTKEIRSLFNTYSITSSLILIGILFMYCKFIPDNHLLIYIGLATSILMAFLHLKITYLIHKMLKP